ncbi:MAG: cytochrome b [Wenzhouxiangellaceae bacterium]|nr:cytochrome b [Wenzhouxiangellaceae bacterium]
MKIPIRNTDEFYGLVAQALHWGIVVGIITQFVWAWRIDEAESIRREFALVNQHKSIGMSILGLVVLRLAWRAYNRPPPYPHSMSRWEKPLAGATHWLLYGLIVLIPLSGWAYSSAAGYGAEFFGLVDIPGFVPANETAEEILGQVHKWLGRALLALVALHVLAALRHHFILKDKVLKRMLPLWK